jgi:predicted AlkP superfamily phosphohydrolase/phosphomutase
LTLTLTLLTSGALVGCGDSETRRQRVLLIGIDGATFRVAGPLLEEGRLPNLAGIARQGVSGPLRSIQPILSPRIWNTIATGKLPEKHGILSFVHKDETGANQLFLSTDRKAHALWNIVSDAGFSVGVVNWWNTYPPDRINGVVISDHVIASEVKGYRKILKSGAIPSAQLVFPGPWYEKVGEILKDPQPATSIEDPFAPETELPHWVEKSRPLLSRRFAEDDTVTRIARKVQRESDPDLMMVFLPGIDRICHFLWGTLEPPELYHKNLHPSPAAREGGAWAIRRYYEYTDALIGILLEGYGPDDLVMVVSDHGFEAGVELMFLTGVHHSEKAIDGVVFARGRDIPAGGDAGPMSVNDVTPTILAWLGLPIGKDMDGRPASFLQTRPPKQIPTHDATPIERVTDVPSGAEKEIVEQLRELGYVE